MWEVSVGGREVPWFCGVSGLGSGTVGVEGWRVRNEMK